MSEDYDDLIDDYDELWKSRPKEDDSFAQTELKLAEKREKIDAIISRTNVKKHSGWILICAMWSFFGFVMIYLVFVVINSFGSIDIEGVISMREVISIVFAFGAGSVISNQFKNFLKS